MEAVSMTVFRPARRPSYVARWVDPTTGKSRERTLRTRLKREAVARAADLAERVVSHVSVDRLAWDAFCDKYERLRISQTSEKNQESWTTTRRHVAEYGAPVDLDAVSGLWVAEWQAWLRGKGLAPNSVAVSSRYLRAALRWAAKKDLLPRCPAIEVGGEHVPHVRRARAL